MHGNEEEGEIDLNLPAGDWKVSVTVHGATHILYVEVETETVSFIGTAGTATDVTVQPGSYTPAAAQRIQTVHAAGDGSFTAAGDPVSVFVKGEVNAASGAVQLDEDAVHSPDPPTTPTTPTTTTTTTTTTVTYWVLSDGSSSQNCDTACADAGGACVAARFADLEASGACQDKLQDLGMSADGTGRETGFGAGCRAFSTGTTGDYYYSKEGATGECDATSRQNRACPCQ